MSLLALKSLAGESAVLRLNEFLNVNNQPRKQVKPNDAPDFLSQDASIEQRTKHYIETRWNDQYRYYSAKALQNRSQHLRLQTFVAVIAVLVPVLLGFNGGLINLMRGSLESGIMFGVNVGWIFNENTIRFWIEFINAVPAILSGLVAGATALENVQKYGDNWRTFQSAADGMERERALFEANAGPYRTSENPYRLFVERSEDVIAQESGRYFAREEVRGKDDPDKDSEEFAEILEDADDLLDGNTTPAYVSTGLG